MWCDFVVRLIMRFFKKILLFGAAMLAMSPVSCTKNHLEDTPCGKETVTIYLSADSKTTRTMLQDDRQVLWTNGDIVVVNEKPYFVTVDSSDPSVAKLENVEKANEYLALYTVCDIMANGQIYMRYYYNDGIYSMPINELPEYRPGTFAPYANPMIAWSKNTNLNFKGLGGVIKVGLTGTDINLAKVQVYAYGEENISGFINITEEQIRALDASAAVIDDENDPSPASEIDCGDGVSLSSLSPTYFYFVVAPFEDPSGLAFGAEDVDGHVYFKNPTQGFSIARNEIKEMTEIELTRALDLVGQVVAVGDTDLKVDFIGSPLGRIEYAAVTQEFWNSHPSNMPTEERVDGIFGSMAAQHAKKFINLDGTGKATITFTDAEDMSDRSALVPGSDYKIIARYYYGKGLGNILILDAKTSGQPSKEGMGIEDFTFGGRVSW